MASPYGYSARLMNGAPLGNIEHTVAEGVASEHIFIGTEEGEERSEVFQPHIVRERFELNNRGRGIHTELTLFDEGFLSVREQRRGDLGTARLINLRFLDPVPSHSRLVALKTLYAGIGLAAAGAVCGALAAFSILTAFSLPAGVGLATAAAVTFMLFVYRTQEESIFYTTNGRAQVLTLLGTLGCLHACRGLVPELKSAIGQARETNHVDKTRYLREEMREHYRLRDDGILSHHACAVSTQKILAKFD